MSLKKLRPAAVSTTYDNWTIGAGASKVIAVDPGGSFTDDDATSYIASVAAPTVGPLSAVAQGFTLSTRPELSTLTSLKIRARCSTSGAVSDSPVLSCFFRLGGVDGSVFTLASVNSAWATTLTSEMINYRPGGPPGSSPFSLNDLLDPTLELVIYVQDWVSGSGQKVWVSTLWVEVTGTPTPTQLSQTRERMSERLRLRRRPQVMYGFKSVSPDFLNMDPLEEVSVTSASIPNAAGLGAGDARAKRRLMRPYRASYNFRTRKIERFDCRDVRRDLIQFWDTGAAVRPGPTAHGVARWDIGVGRTYTRNSKAWVRDQGSVIREVDVDEEMLNRIGIGMHRPSSNLLIQSAFRNGAANVFTGWTQGGTGVNGSTIVDDTSSLLFDPVVSSRSVKMVAGTPHTTDLTLTSTATGSIAANTKVTLFVDIGAALSARLQRSSDSKYWDGAAWQVGVQTFALTGGIPTIPIDVGAAITTLTLTIVMPSGGTSGRVANVYFAQIEDLPWFSARIVTDTVAVQRAQCRLLISNNGTARFWRRSGTFQVEFNPRWNSADAAAGAYIFMLASCVFDANNHMKLFYDAAAGQWVFQRKAAGVTYNATLTAAVSNVGSYIVTCRATSPDGEVGLTALTQSIFVNGAKGTDVVSVRPTQVATVDAGLGCEAAGANTADGNLRNVMFTEQVLTDQEIARGNW
jgi:hypothetical protein